MAITPRQREVFDYLSRFIETQRQARRWLRCVRTFG
jgi:hypothetical protein